MRRSIAFLPALATLLLAGNAFSQPPRSGDFGGPPPEAPANQPAPADRLMQFDANNDGVLSAEELTDRRLHRLLTAADENSDGSLSRAELMAYFDRQAREFGGNRGPGSMRGFGGGEGPGLGGDFPGAGRPPFPGGPGGPGGLGQPGQILPEFLQQELNLSEEQRRELAALQTRVDEQLARILTPEQKQQLQRMTPPRGERPFGPGGPGGPRPGRPASGR